MARTALVEPIEFPTYPPSLGRYTILDLLGEGGHARVYRAVLEGPAGFAKPVALKVMKESGCEDRSRMSLITEARLGVLLRHPNVVDVYELEEYDNGLVMAMELVEGISLRELIASIGPPSPASVLRIGIQICDGLLHAHTLEVNNVPVHIVHRDLKPANILLTRWGQVKIADFGLAKARSIGQEEMDDGRICGSPAYMSPEQIQGVMLDARSDLFSLGAVIYELTTGQRLFPGESYSRVAFNVLGIETRWRNTDIADRLETAIPGMKPVLWRCLRRNPGERFGDVGILRDALIGLHEAQHDPPSFEGEIARAFETPLQPIRETGAEDTVITQTIWRTDETNTGRWHTNVEHTADGFVGRQTAMDQLMRALREGHRLISITGTGGVGKSRLAREFARHLLLEGPRLAGAWRCGLSDARTLPGILHAMASTLGVSLAHTDALENHVEQIGRAFDAHGPVLVILDQIEHLLDDIGPLIATWRALAPRAWFLVTSRHQPHLEGEHIVALPPLPPNEAVTLFLTRARALRPRYAQTPQDQKRVAEIVDRLDGLPLAIELAAARAPVFEPEPLLQRLDAEFTLLSESRTSTLGHAIGLSWDLLTQWEQRVLAQCSVFEGGFFMDAAEAVVDLSDWTDAPWVMDIVGMLLDKNLLHSGSARGVPDAPRFGMYSTIHTFAAAQLSTDETLAEATRHRHAQHFAHFGSRAEQQQRRSYCGIQRTRRLHADLSNLVVAAHTGHGYSDPDIAVCAGRAAAEVMQLTGPALSVSGLLDTVLTLPNLSFKQRAEVLLDQAWGWISTHRSRESRSQVETALAMARQSKDTYTIAIALSTLANISHEEGRPHEARTHYAEALALSNRCGARDVKANILGHLGIIDKQLGNVDAARGYYTEALRLARLLGDRRAEGNWVGNLGVLEVQSGNEQGASDAYLTALAIQREIGDRRGEGLWLGNLGVLRWHQGRMREARALHEAALEIQRQTGDKRHEGLLLGNLGDLALAEGDLTLAQSHLEEAVDRASETDSKLVAGAFLGSLSELYARQGDLAQAKAALVRAQSLLDPLGYRAELGKLACRRGHIALAAGDVNAAREAIIEALDHARALEASSEAEISREVVRLQVAMAAFLRQDASLD